MDQKDFIAFYINSAEKQFDRFHSRSNRSHLVFFLFSVLFFLAIGSDQPKIGIWGTSLEVSPNNLKIIAPLILSFTYFAGRIFALVEEIYSIKLSQLWVGLADRSDCPFTKKQALMMGHKEVMAFEKALTESGKNKHIMVMQNVFMFFVFLIVYLGQPIVIFYFCYVLFCDVCGLFPWIISLICLFFVVYSFFLVRKKNLSPLLGHLNVPKVSNVGKNTPV